MRGVLARRAGSIARWSACGAALGMLIGVAILLIDARWYAVQPEPAVVISREATVPELVVDGCRDATFAARLIGPRPGLDHLVTFKGCLGDHVLGEAIEIRRHDGRVSVDLGTPLSAAARVGLIALVLGGPGALLAVRDAALWDVVMGPIVLVRRWRGRRTER